MRERSRVARLFAVGAAHHQAGRLAEAETVYGEVLRLDPAHADTLHRLGVLATQTGRTDEAAARFRQALGVDPDHPLAHYNLGNLLQDQGALSEAINCFRQAVRLRPDFPEALNNLGNALKDQGRFGEAMAEFDKALAVRPDYAEALFNRGTIKTIHAGDPDLKDLETRVAGADALSAAQAMFLHFALGRALDSAGEPTRAFEQFLKGNALKRRAQTYDEAGTRAQFQRIKARFDEALFRSRPGGGDPSPVPIFVVGMPRSGSTLVEQILASHPLVFGAGELGLVQRLVEGQSRPYPDFVPALTAPALARLGHAYLAGLPETPAGVTRVTDKMPGNFLYLGLIRLMLPAARIIHTCRDPVDTCISCFSTLFTVRQEFSYNLGELGRYYREYQDLMAHWRSVLPAEAFLDVRYEAVVEDLEGQARQLIAYCGLPWDERCLDFHKTRRMVRTASAAQVRQPLYRDSLGRARRYQSFLQPLIRELGDS